MKDELEKFNSIMVQEVGWKVLIVFALFCGMTFGDLFSGRILI
jgi:hypothetical protein